MDSRVPARRQTLRLEAADGLPTELRDLVFDAQTQSLFVIDAGGSQAPEAFTDTGRILRVDPVTGYATVVGGCVDGSRPNSTDCFDDPFGLTLLNGHTVAGRQLVVTNPNRRDLSFSDPINNDGEIWLLDPITGNRSMISSGGELWDPQLVTVDPNTDRIYVAEYNNSGGGTAVVAIDPVSAAQQEITAGGPLLFNLPVGITFEEATGDLIVVATFLGLVRVDPDNPSTTGANQTVIAPNRGLLRFPLGVRIDSGGNYIVGDWGTLDHRGAMFRIDGRSGAVRPLFVNNPGSGLCCVNGFVEIVP